MAKSRARKAALRRRKPTRGAGADKGVPPIHEAPAGLLAGVDHGAQVLTPNGTALRRSPDNAVVQLEGADATNFGRTRVRVVTQNVVDVYFLQKKLSRRQWRAANMIAGAFRRARFDTLKIANLLGAGGGRSTLDEMSKSTIAARVEYAAKMQHIGMVAEKAIFWIVISNYSARDFAHKENLGRDDGFGVLRLALSALADSYGLPADKEPCPVTPPSGRIAPARDDSARHGVP